MTLTRSRAVRGAVVGSLLAGGIVALVGASLFLRARNQGELALIRAPAASYAGALARQAARLADDPAAVQPRIEKLRERGQDIKLAAVVLEPRSTRYRFLRKRRYLAHSDPSRVRSVLDRRHASDKSVYDLANKVRRKGRLLEVTGKLGAPTVVMAGEPITVRGKHHGMALVITQPGPPPAGPPAWPLALGLLLVMSVGGVAGAVTARYRYLAVLLATAASSALAATLLARVSQFYGAKIAAAPWAEGAGALERAPGAMQAASSFEASGGWGLLAATLAALAIGLLGLLGIGARIARSLRLNVAAYAYILPAAMGMMLLVFLPFGYGLALGFFNHANGTYTYVGLDNFIEILSGGGRPLSHPLNFYFTLGVTVLWTAINVALHVTIGLCLALVLKDPLLRFKGVYRVLLILPWAVPNYITALIWKGMFHNQYGAVNHLLSLLGIEQVSWFSNFSTAFCANVVTNTWLGFPFMMVVCLGALQSIPRDVYEAADVDGASRWQAFWSITMPLLRPALFPAVILGTIWTFNQFNIIYLVSGGAPGGSTDILITEAYRWAFERADRYGLAAAYALIILVILLGYTLITNRLTKATEDAYR